MKNFFRPGIAMLLIVYSEMVNAQVPILSSHPSSSAVIFLDFDGHTVSGTSWNYNGPIECGASGLDNLKITEIFNRIAEDYRPFDVNVTTDSTKFLSARLGKRIRVIFTVSSSWYGNAGGVAFVGSFTYTDNTPAFVFTALLGSSCKLISEAGSHEAGHTLGLYHQAIYDASCNKVSEYHPGTGSGEIAWAPIMGVGYYRNFTLWNNGPNSYGCANMQNDLDIITTRNGFTYRADDHGNEFNYSTRVDFSNRNKQFAVNGVIEKNTDYDLFKFTMPEDGSFQLNAVPYNVGTGNAGSNLDMQVTLFNSTQVVLNAYNPGTLLSSVIDTSLSAGTYYLRVEGKGNVFAPSYASLGSYSLEGSYTAGVALPLHKLELSGSQQGDHHKLNWEIIADEQITDLSIEIATDGRNFSSLTQTGQDARSYMYRPFTSGVAQYRLNVTFDNGRQYYSNVIALRSPGRESRPQLVGNLITGSSIVVSSPGKFMYRIFDMSGRAIQSGRLTNGLNTINAPQLHKGVYVIRYGDQQQDWTDKFLQQ